MSGAKDVGRGVDGSIAMTRDEAWEASARISNRLATLRARASAPGGLTHREELEAEMLLGDLTRLCDVLESDAGS